MRSILLSATVLLIFFSSCQKKYEVDGSATTTANLVFKFKFDSTQARLNNIGQPSTMPAGHAGLSPRMNAMSAHYVELAPSALTLLGKGAVLYKASETTAGGATAIDFSKAVLAGDGETFLTVPVKDVAPGSYEYVRVSLAYQNFDVWMHLDTVINTPLGPLTVNDDFPGTAAAFVGYNTYINSFTLKTKTFAVNGNRLQGFCGFETNVTVAGQSFISSGMSQSPPGATTVVNPISSTSPIPAGSCLATGAFQNGAKLTITGNETKDIVVVVSLSVNKSFEWKDTNGNNKWDATKGEAVVDMGIRGLIPIIQ